MVATVPIVGGIDTTGDAGYIRMVAAAVENAKLDLAHRCNLVNCGTSRPTRNPRCGVRESAERFLRDMRAGRHWLCGWVTLAAMRAGLSIEREPEQHEPVPVLFVRSSEIEPEARGIGPRPALALAGPDDLPDDDDPGQPVDVSDVNKEADAVLV